MHMTFTWKGFNKIFDYVKKLEGVVQVGEAKMMLRIPIILIISVGLSQRASISRPIQPVQFHQPYHHLLGFQLRFFTAQVFKGQRDSYPFIIGVLFSKDIIIVVLLFTLKGSVIYDRRMPRHENRLRL